MCFLEIDLNSKFTGNNSSSTENTSCFLQETRQQGFKAHYFLCSVQSHTYPVKEYFLPLWVSVLVWLFAPPLKPLHVCSLHLSLPPFLSLPPPVYPSSFTCSCVPNLFHSRTHYNSGDRIPIATFHCCFFHPPPIPTGNLHTGCRIGSIHVWFGVCWGMINKITPLSCRDFRPHTVKPWVYSTLASQVFGPPWCIRHRCNFLLAMPDLHIL